jgi:hypothetical protein
LGIFIELLFVFLKVRYQGGAMLGTLIGLA